MNINLIPNYSKLYLYETEEDESLVSDKGGLIDWKKGNKEVGAKFCRWFSARFVEPLSPMNQKYTKD